eukprot:96816_1
MPQGRGNAPSKSGKETWDRHSKKKRKHQHYKIRNQNYSHGMHKNTFAAHSNNNTNNDQQNQSNLQSNTNNNNLQNFIDTMQITKQQQSKKTNFNQQLQQATIFNPQNIPIPRKPKWNKIITKQQLHQIEQETFLNWRRNLAKTIQYVTNKNNKIEISPFEKNLNVWKQLWQVIEKSNLLIIVVDARNPLAFISKDLLKYIKEVNPQKNIIILLNKADYLNSLQRKYWKQFFEKKNIKILFFSAINEQIKLNLLSNSKREIQQNKLEQEEKKESNNIMDRIELSKIFLNEKNRMQLDGITIGLIGYPNVGKSSIINVLMNKKVVSMGSLPGKTKHLQTFHLDNEVIVCDCPGLVFPVFSLSKCDMVLNGVISIDNLIDFIKPMQLVVNRIDINGFNTIYKLKLNNCNNKLIGVYDVLDAYCNQQKMYNKGKVPDRNKAARIMLKDYIKGKLVYNHCPPSLNSQNKKLFYQLN